MTTVRVDWRGEADRRLDRAVGTHFDVEGFTPFRGRDLSCTWEVEVYRNLHELRRTGRVRWSIRDTDSGLVLGHADKLAVAGARVHVNVAAQQRIQAGEARTVHAWISGRLAFCPTDTSPWLARSRRVTYRPHVGPYFWFEGYGQRFVGTTGNQVVRFDSRGMWAW